MLKYLSLQIKSQLEYKSSFIFLCISQFLAFLMYCVTFYALFEKFGMLKSFNIYQVILCFSIVQFGENTAEAVFRGFDQFSKIIKKGEFDMLLVRPQNIYLQILGTKIEIAKFVKSLFAVILLVISIIKLKISLKMLPVILMMLIGSVAIFAAVLIIGAAFCFVTIEGLEVINIFVYGTRDFAQYPIGVYNKGVQIFFTYIIPIALTSYYPMLYITNNSTNLLYAFLPIISCLFVIPACLIFNAGIRKYKSSGS